MPAKRKSAELTSEGRVKQGLARAGKKIQPNTSGAAGRYRTAIEPVPIDKEVFQDKEGKRLVHWDIVQQMYVEGWPTTNENVRYWPNLKELSEMTGVNYQRIQNRSSSERWALLQQGFKGSFINERKKRRIETLVNLSFDFDDIQLEVASRGAEMVLNRQEQLRRVAEIQQKYFEEALKELESGEIDTTSEKLRGGIWHVEQESLAKAAALWQEIGMKALGTDKERIELTGADGGAVSMHQISSSEEMSRPDTVRLAAVMQSWRQIEELNKPRPTNLEEAEETPQIEAGIPYREEDVIDVDEVDVTEL